jgi:hypothetical protein
MNARKTNDHIDASVLRIIASAPRTFLMKSMSKPPLNPAIIVRLKSLITSTLMFPLTVDFIVEAIFASGFPTIVGIKVKETSNKSLPLKDKKIYFDMPFKRLDA